ncbi:glycerol transporter [Tilletia horrida]|uniref:Glycerol transporter n=1 Tax=Tilletia horrida TaxID=155126 RepID=A0AAN6GCX4_9BASI|nr:glycerol transporter [Tilletia horrida]
MLLPSHAEHTRPHGAGQERAERSMTASLLGDRGLASLTVDEHEISRGANTGAGAGAGARAGTGGPRARPSRWGTTEFKVYFFAAVVLIPYMVWVPISISQENHPNFPQYRHLLREGWLLGRLRDNSDHQYRTFRSFVSTLVGVAALYTLLSRLAALAPRLSLALFLPSATAHAPRNRLPFLTTFSAIFLLALHGTNALKILAFAGVNYALAHRCGDMLDARLVVPAVWAFNVGALFLAHWTEGLPWRLFGASFAWLDDHTGLLPRWFINYNISMLRLVSFALDCHWAQGGSIGSSGAGGHQGVSADGPVTPSQSHRSRTTQSASREEYSSFLLYMTYVAYPPLFIAGPIMTFNDFAAQLRQPLPISRATLASYALRWLFCFLTMEFVLHFIWVNAIKDAKAWAGLSLMELSMVGFWNLIVVWLKLLIPWRFFRLWAMLDGVDAPENMIRCMANNYSTLGFWRSWHRSYNLWIVRYIYVPVGGAANAVPATLLVFTFVALWHDLSLKLLAWGWLVTLFIVPELTARWLVPAKKYGDEPWYRIACGAGGVFNVLLMMSANLVGFAIGLDGMKYMVQQLTGTAGGWSFLASCCAALYCGVQLMMEYREEELRRGIVRKC